MTFDVDVNGILSVTAKELVSGQRSMIKIEDSDRLDRIELYANIYDHFFAMVCCLRPWKEAEDTSEYREQRATDLFNAGPRLPHTSSTAQPPACALSRGLCARSQPRCVATT